MQVKKMLILVFLLLSLPCLSQAADRYATATGGATSGSCPIGTPCTLSYAISGSTAGDTIIVNPGTYTDSSLTLSKRLTITTTPDIISALGTFTHGIPSGTDNRPYFPAVNVYFSSGSAYSVIQYMRFRNAASPWNQSGGISGSWSGVVTINSMDVALKYSEVWNGGNGIGINVGRAVVIDNCYIHDLGVYGTGDDNHGIGIYYWNQTTKPTTYADGIQILNNTITNAGGDGIQDGAACYGGESKRNQYETIDNNVIHHCYEQCLDTKGVNYVTVSRNDFYDASPLFIFTDPEECNPTPWLGWDIWGNTFHDCNNGAMAFSNTAEIRNARIWNNIYYNLCSSPDDNQCAALIVISGNGSTMIYENTFYNNVRSGGGTNDGGVVACGTGTASNIKNNIFYQNGSTRGNIATGSPWMCSNVGMSISGTPDYNYVYPASPGMTGNHAITSSDPGMTNPSGHIFTLLSTSVCKDAGTTLGSPYNVDILGYTRPSGSAYDLGAYEYGAGPGDTTPPTVTITTNGGNNFSTTGSTITLDGNATDNVAVSSISSSPSGTVSGTTIWIVSGIPLSVGSNLITITATDSSNNIGTDTITVTRTQSPTVVINTNSGSDFTTSADTIILEGLVSSSIVMNYIAAVTWLGESLPPLVSSILYETFEGTGYYNGPWVPTTSGGGIVNPDFLNSAIPNGANSLEDLQVLRVYYDGVFPDKAYITRTLSSSYDEVWCRFMFRLDALTFGGFFDIFTLLDSNSVGILSAWVVTDPSSKLNFSCGADVSGPAIAIDTTYYAWVYYKKSSGVSDGVVRMYLSTSNSLPASPSVEIVGHNEIGSVNKVALFKPGGTWSYPAGPTNVYFDHIFVGNGGF